MIFLHPFLRCAGILLLLVTLGGLSPAQVTVQMSPATPIVQRGGTVALDVNIAGATNLLASHVSVTFDATKLQYNGVTNGSLMPLPPSGFFQSLVNGNVVTVDHSVLDQAPVSGTGTLFTISFTALDAVSASQVTLTSDLRDPANSSIPSIPSGAQVTIENPLPHVTGLVPSTITAGSPTFDLVVNGSGFIPASIVWFKGVARTTSYQDASTLKATLGAADLIAAGAFPVTVVNAGPGGGTSSETVNLQINAGPAANISLTSGDGQSTPISTALPQPLVVTITDANNNPVQGVPVTFTLETKPSGETGTSLSQTDVTTNASGQASSSLTLGNKVGSYTVSATSAGLTGSPVTFTATALAGPLDHFNIGALTTQTEGTPFDVTVTAADAADNIVTSFAGPVALSYSGGTITPQSSGSFTNGIVTVSVLVTGAGAGQTISVADGGSPAHTGISNTFDALAMPNAFLSGDPSVALAGQIFPGDSWTATAYEGNDWSFLAPTVISVYVVPEPGMTFSAADVALSWDATQLSCNGVVFGSAGTPNGLFGSGQAYAHTQSAVVNASSLTISASRTDAADFAPVNAGDYIARVDFTLLKPCHAVVTLQSASFQRQPAVPVQVIKHDADIKAFLGDVASGPPPANEPASTAVGDGRIDFQDLAAWSGSYWSGVPGYAHNMDFYKVKYDIGPTQDGSVFSMPTVNGTIDFEDLVIFSISYGLSSNGQLPKIAPPSGEPVNIYLAEPVQGEGETRIAVMLSGSVADVRALRLELKGDFGSFLGAEKGELLKEVSSDAMVMNRSGEGEVFVDLAVLGLRNPGLSKPGEMVVLRFDAKPSLHLTKYEARNSANVSLPLTKVRGAGESVPVKYMLKQNYPNPFNPATTIEYEVPSAGPVVLEVFNTLGQKVATLLQEVQESGVYQVRWNGRDANDRPVTSGLYLYRMHAGQFTSVKKMVLVK